jgi:hypothetical protein
MTDGPLIRPAMAADFAATIAIHAHVDFQRHNFARAHKSLPQKTNFYRTIEI